MNSYIKLTAVALAMAAAIPWLSVKKTDAAPPDGNGPWADTVVATAQAMRKDGTAVLPERSDPASMLGPAENTLAAGTFYSLGFGGKATLGFDNGFADGVLVIESTALPYPVETANVEVSENGTDWVLAGSVRQDGSVAVPDENLCVRYVRVTDTSDPSLFEATADGYDIDGVSAYGRSCTNDGKMTGGGSFWVNEMRVTHGMELLCDGTKGTLEVNWNKGNKFQLTKLESALCEDNPAIIQGSPEAMFDTYHGHGTGKYNGVEGYHAYWTFTDEGEPGTKDHGRLTIWDPTMTNMVLDIPWANLDKGNQQAH